MEEKLIEFSTAKLAKEKGFNVECRYGYTKSGNLITIDRSQESFFSGASRSYKNSGLESYNKSYLEYNDDTFICIYTAPTQSLLQKWLREVHNISIKVDDFYTNGKLRFDFSISELGSQEDNPKGIFEDYEEALEVGLQEALKLIK